MTNYLGTFAFGLFLTITGSRCDSIKHNLTYDYFLTLVPWREDSSDSYAIQFDLFTRKNPNQSQIISPVKEEILKSNYNPHRQNKVLIHGFLDGVYDTNFIRIKDEYLIQDDYNVWLVDWSKLASGPPLPLQYNEVVYKMSAGAKFISEMLKKIRDVSRVPKNAFHVIGHSLGAHMAGYVAEDMKPYRIARITGLDPAKPCFENTQKKNRPLAKGDAKFVDIIHTNCYLYGKLEALGDIDFYVDGGFNQDGCGFTPVYSSVCSHLRAVEYFAESIRSKTGFYGYYCDCLRDITTHICKPDPKIPQRLMGEHVDTKASGIFSVQTNEKPPWAMGPIIDSVPTLVIKPPFNDSKLLEYLDEVLVDEPFDTFEFALSTYQRQNSAQSNALFCH